MNLKEYQKEDLANGAELILFPIEDLTIECPKCKKGTLKNNLKCSACKEATSSKELKVSISIEIEDSRIVSVSKLNNISIYEMELLGIESAINFSTPIQMKRVFNDFEDWYNKREGDYKNTKNVVLVEV